MKEKRRLILAIDFDGTIVKTGNWPEINPDFNKSIVPFARDVINYFHDELNIEIIIWTCRDNSEYDDLDKTIDYLNKNDFHYDYMNKNSEYIRNKWPNDSRKVFADFYIDDKSIFCNNVNWIEIKNKIIKFKQENSEKYI